MTITSLDRVSLAVRVAGTLVITYPTLRGRRIILTRRPATMRRHPGQIAFPGGMIEDSDESPLAGATREAQEEIGLKLPPGAAVKALMTVTTLSSYIVIHPFWVDLPTNPRLERSTAEVEEILRIPVRDLQKPAARQSVAHPRRLGEQTMAYVWRAHTIWGATAAILQELLYLVGEQ